MDLKLHNIEYKPGLDLYTVQLKAQNTQSEVQIQQKNSSNHTVLFWIYHTHGMAQQINSLNPFSTEYHKYASDARPDKLYLV